MKKKTIFSVSGMHCASCAAIITKSLQAVGGIHEAVVNYATETAKVVFDADKVSMESMNDTIEKYGYRLHTKEMTESNLMSDHEDHLKSASSQSKQDMKENEMDEQKAKTEFAFPISVAVFFIMMWDIAGRTFVRIPNIPLPMEMVNGIFLVLATVVMFWIGRPFMLGVSRFARHRVANMDTLIGIGTLSAYLYSVFITFAPSVQNKFQLPDYTYFDVVIVVIGFVTFGKYLEARSKKKTGEAIEKLLNLQVKTALVLRNGREMEIPISEVVVGDVMRIKPGSKIPVDGKIIKGSTSIDESMITGESMPVDKQKGDFVIGSTLNKQGSFQCIATQVGHKTMLSQIIRMVEEAQGSKAPIQALADKVSSVFVPIVLGIAVASLLVWIFVGSLFIGYTVAISYGILSFVGVLIIACPCALGLATPTALIVGMGKGAGNGILVRDAESLELLSKVDTVVFDKTGTITQGKPVVTDVVVLESGFDEREILLLSSSVEKMSEHPLANAIVDKARSMGIETVSVRDFQALEGIGVQARVTGKVVLIGKPERGETTSELRELQAEGKTVVIVTVNGKRAGLIALADTVKKEASSVITNLHKWGIQVILLSGDNKNVSREIARQVHIDSVIAEVLPNEKARKIQALQTEGRVVAMVGDGINDAPALVQANVGIAMATGTDIAIESAGITILHGDLQKIVQAIELSRVTIRTVKQNLFWAFLYNIVGIPIAAGILYPLWGIILNPIFAGLAMAFSSVSVVANSLRLKSKRLQ